MRFDKNEEAVSPVIGVILMVAITVILAAVIAVFVFGMADGVQTTKTVAVTAQVSGTNITVTFQGGPDAGKVASINGTVYKTDGNTAGTASIEDPSVGEFLSFPGNNTVGGEERVLVTGTFNDGTTQILLDKFV